MAILLVSVLKRKISKMSKINVSQWKKFKLTELFEPHHGKRLTKRNRVPGEIPFLTAGFDNQGVKGYLAGNFEIWHNPISIDMFGNCFYHECDCTGDDNVYALVNNAMTSNVKLFIAGVLNKQLSIQFSYKDQFRQHDLDVLSIKLPADSAGNPDWHYMDEYIAKLATQAHTNISLLRQQQKKAPTVNIDRWKEFKLPELFTVSSGTKFDKRRVILTPEPHNINFIGRTGSLNGINAKCGIYKNTEPFSAGLLTVALGGTIGACFVQDKPFYTSQNVDVLIPLKCYVSKMTWNVKQFIASCIFYESQNNYLTFVRELNKHIKRDFVIKLPVDSTGHPDWQYMDKYIAKLATQAHTNISLLCQQQKKAPTVNIGVARKTYGKRNVQQ